jgi:hypothetical protein
MSIINAFADIIRMYPGWTMFCIVMLFLALASRIEH